MIGLQGLLTVYGLFVVFGLIVVATFAVRGSLQKKAERLQPSERLRDIRAERLRPPPAAYPSKTQAQVPQTTSEIPKLVRIDRDRAPVPSGTPDDEPIVAEIVADLDDEEAAADMERPVLGTDGETSTGSPPIPPKPTRPAASVSNAELRRWARNSGLSVADRGPIPGHIREAWAKAANR